MFLTNIFRSKISCSFILNNVSLGIPTRLKRDNSTVHHLYKVSLSTWCASAANLQEQWYLQQRLYFACHIFFIYLKTIYCTIFLFSRLFRTYFVHWCTVLVLYILLIYVLHYLHFYIISFSVFAYNWLLLLLLLSTLKN